MLLQAGAVFFPAVTPNCHKLLFANKNTMWHSDCYATRGNQLFD
jgi:hypothetical protein